MAKLLNALYGSRLFNYLSIAAMLALYYGVYQTDSLFIVIVFFTVFGGYTIGMLLLMFWHFTGRLK